MSLPYYRSNLIVLSVTTFLAAASWTQVVPFLPLFLAELGIDENLNQWAGVVFGLQYAAGIMMAPLWGRIADRHGRKLMTVRAGACLSAIYILTGLSTQPWHVAVMRFLNGALTGFIPSSIALVAANTPKELAPRYVASLQTAQAAGTVVGPAIGGVFASVFGIRGGLYISGCVVGFATLLVLFIVKEKHPGKPKERTTLLQDFQTAIHSPTLLTVMVITVVAMFSSIAVQPVLSLYVQELSGSASTALSGLIFSLPGLALVLTANQWVRIGERIGYRVVMRRALLAAACVMAVIPFLRSILWFGVAYFVQGVFVAALRPTSSAMISTEVDSSFHGRAFGMQQSATTLGGMFGPTLAGFFAGIFGAGSVFWLISAVMLAGFGSMYVLAKAPGVSPAAHGEPKAPARP